MRADNHTEETLDLQRTKNSTTNSTNKQSQRKNTKQRFKEVRPCRLRPRGKKGGGFLLISANQYTYSNGDRESSASALLSSTIALIQKNPSDTNPRNPTQPLNRVQNNPFRKTARPDCRSTGRSTDPMHRSTGPVDRAQPRVGALQSVDRPVDRSPSAVDRTGRPLPVHVCVHVGRPERSTEPLLLPTVDRAGRPYSCSAVSAAADFWIPFSVDSSTSSPYMLCICVGLMS